MQSIDWIIVASLFAFTCFMGWYASRFTKSVSDFLSAGRCARRYLISIAESEAGNTGFSAVHMIAYFEMFYQAGFTAAWWPILRAPVYLIIAVSGWVLYRYRQSGAMTMAQFFEMRYSRKFRIFAGILSFGCGMMFFAIFPSVAGHFFIYFCGLPEFITVFSINLPTHILVMGFIIGISLIFTTLGGQLTVLVTDFVQGLFTNLAVLAIFIAIFSIFSWTQISEALAMAPAQHSMVDAFKSADNKDFNFWFFLISAYLAFYTAFAWQGGQGFYSSAISPHEARIGKMLGNVRCWAQYAMMFVLPIACYALMHLPSHSATASQVSQTLDTISDKQISTQMTVPISTRFLLPHGSLGLMCAIMLAAFIGCTSSYLHSWGSIFIQDIIMPFRKQSFETDQHLRILRWAIVGVAVCAFLGGIAFKQTQYLFMYMAIVGAIYTGGAGAVIIGGLYWKRGTTTAAWASMIMGAVISIFAIAMDYIWPLYHDGKKFPINGQYMTFIAVVCCTVSYILISKLSRTKPFDLFGLLHRNTKIIDVPVAKKASFRLLEKLGITTEFSRGEVLLVCLMTTWSVGWCIAAIITMIYYFIFGISHKGWMNFWLVYTGMTIFLGSIVTIWFAIGGVRDLQFLFKTLATRVRDYNDDGTVEQPATSARAQRVAAKEESKR